MIRDRPVETRYLYHDILFWKGFLQKLVWRLGDLEERVQTDEITLIKSPVWMPQGHKVRVLFLDVDGVLHPAMCGIQLQKALGTEEMSLKPIEAQELDMAGFRTQPSCIAGHFVRTPGSVGLTSGHVSRLLTKLQKEPTLPPEGVPGLRVLPALPPCRGARPATHIDSILEVREQFATAVYFKTAPCNL
eukprot:g22449.t1